MKYEYENIVKHVCGDDWCSDNRSADEKDGGFGVAMILAFIRGTSSRLNDLAREINVPPYALDMAYKRLQINGLLSNRSWVLTDPLLCDYNSNHNPMSRLRAWSHIAGLSSGFCGLGQTREEYDQARENFEKTMNE